MRGAASLVAVAPRWAESCITEDDGVTVIALVWPERPFTMNEIRRMHFRVERKLIQHWRGVFSDMAANCPRLAWADLTVLHEVGRRIIPDHAACAPAVKAGLDGCCDRVEEDGTVHAGILPDDSPMFVRRMTFEAPQFTGRYALTLEFRGELASSAAQQG